MHVLAPSVFGHIGAIALLLVACDSAESAAIDASARASADAQRVADAQPSVDALSIDAGTCSLMEQLGCGVGEACDIDKTAPAAGPGCRPITAAGVGEEACLNQTECAAGFFCRTLDDDAGICHQFCVDDTDCPGVRSQCQLPLYDATVELIEGFLVCSSDCDPADLDPAACAADESCQFILYAPTGDPTDGTVVLPYCAAATGGAEGADCGSIVDCSAGHLCRDSVCRRLCKNVGADCLDALGTCSSISDSNIDTIVIGSDVELGYCAQ